MISLLLASAPLLFKGGSIDELARTLSLWTDRPVVALVQTIRNRPPGGGPSAEIIEQYRKMGVKVTPMAPEWKAASNIRKFEVDRSLTLDDKDLKRLLLVKSHIAASASPRGVAIWNPGWQGETTQPIGTHSALPDGWSAAKPESLKLIGGKLSVNLPPHQAVQVRELLKLDWVKPIKIHWLPNSMWVIPVVKSLNEKDFLEVLADAVCGKLTETKDEFRIDLNPKSFRQRAQAYLGEHPLPDHSPSLNVAGYRIAWETWNWIDDQAILDLYEFQSHAAILPVKKGTPLEIALSQYVDAYRQRANAADPPGSDDSAGMKDMLRRIDWSRPPRIMISQNLGVGGGWPAVGGGTVSL